MTVKIIAEAGVNHNGSKELAFKLIDAAYEANVDFVKFQTFKAKNLVTKDAKQADYQARNTGVAESQLDMLSRLELDYDVHHELVSYCNELGVEFLSTAFDQESLDFLVDDLKLKILKIPSGELTNAPFVLRHAQTGCDLIVSTGMATLAEIEAALSVIAFGLINDVSVKPSEEAFARAYSSNEGQEALKSKVTVLHCTTEYPAPVAEVNLKSMQTMEQAFGLTIGYSDHTAGITIPIVATALGAKLIEKHFTLDKSLPGPDHKASLDPNELKAMVKGIRDAELSLGSPIKTPQISEIENKKIARKSLVAATDIKAGELFTEDNLMSKRPGTGLSPCLYWSLLGKPSLEDYSEGQPING
ncbi:N-acetylneuraminate synthase [Alkalimarinus sediminis]|uniref:N-acetylneuraminate synthase n=1 Tax=Alkalimarinus sediminis TaxID=1632866 RepID=A0A9E8HIP4_9ALTE|nr:N-acetylneuraminate synthase [Alkalimarinus sediminis]UZW73428.1 N-acetylneuraminate synthase [Alkalimarinus sediminis]